MSEGMCMVTRWEDPSTLPPTWRLRIDQADENIRITDELLQELHKIGWAGEGVFIIEADNGTVRYALQHREALNTWAARRITPWPPDTTARYPSSAETPTAEAPSAENP